MAEKEEILENLDTSFEEAIEILVDNLEGKEEVSNSKNVLLKNT